jgi:CubicO group peptidase (beta-lactamase class C family)
VLARQQPAWPPGTPRYYTLTIGLYMQELIRRVDPAHRTLGRFFHEEIAQPLGLSSHRASAGDSGRTTCRAQDVDQMAWPHGAAIYAVRHDHEDDPSGSLLRRSFMGLNTASNDRHSLEIELPAGMGGTARDRAGVFRVRRRRGRNRARSRDARRITASPVMPGGNDVVLGVPSYFSLGFLRPGPEVWFGSSQRAFGAPGAGGSFGFADPDARLGYAYVMNKLDFYLQDDPREKSLRDAVYRAIARLGAQSPIPASTAAPYGLAVVGSA